MNRTALRISIAVLVCCVAWRSCAALGEKPYVVFSPVANSFAVAQGDHLPPVIAGSDDWPGVVRAAGDFCDDVERVTGRRPTLLTSTANLNAPEIILIGTLGHDTLIDSLVLNGKLKASDIQGKWESAATAIVQNPFPGVTRALVISGSDKRGTIYGVYDLSEQIGVSPWYWWADVHVPHHDALFVEPGRYLQREPAVKYRGIFLNDEAPALSGWSREKFGGFNTKFYAHVFELLLRLKANYLWPAMWGSAFNEDDPANPALADRYGIVMGTSHHEPMLRSQQEWKKHGSGPWDYAGNAKTLQQFWLGGIERNRNFESTVTLGMRGDGDMPMSATDDVALLERIVGDQLQILKQESTPTLDRDPRIWALYKEVQGYYEKGMRVPDNVTLLWSDDNWGNLRRLPTPRERSRSGGAGIYYHFDYVGGPRSYKWINTNPIAKVWEQMHLALEYGADRVWIVNVGDLKPMEFPTEFFLAYARDPLRWDQDHLHEFAVQWATREFGPEHAEEIASDVEDYTRYNGRRKPEQIDPRTFSIGSFDEAARIESEWTGLQKRVHKLASQLREDQRASFFELVQYMVDASANLTEMYIAAARNQLYAQQGRVTANDEAARVRELFAHDRQLSDEYNHVLLNGRWNHMMDQTHIGYDSWKDPPKNIMPAVTTVKPEATGSLHVAAGNASDGVLSLGEFDSLTQQSKSLTLFNRGLQPVSYRITADAPWVNLSSTSGTFEKQHDVAVSVDWRHAPANLAHSQITVTSAGEEVIAQLKLTARRQAITREQLHGFSEADGIVAIEAAHTSSRNSDGATHWVELPGYGRTLSAMTPFPVTSPSELHSRASLDYQFHSYDSGKFSLQMILSPTLNFVPGRGLRLAVSLDDGPRTTVDVLAHNSDRDWSRAVSDAARTVEIPLSLKNAGDHVLHVWYVDPGIVLERLVLHWSALPYSYLGPPETFRGAGSQGNMGTN
ncbi:MAG TPA: glycosyl hydrolase 115 family protein [Acidobacteriaceae bacterium]|jgi:hypothetical protein